MAAKMKPVLDACCGGKMFYIDKHDPDVLFMDNRELDTHLCDGRHFLIAPDIKGDFRNMPFSDNTFSLVIFDPPHLNHAGDKSWLALKYGILGNDWREDIRKGFSECFRVLKPNGTLVFKWSEVQIALKEILSLASQMPLVCTRQSKVTHWCVFINKKARGEE